jgi:hypothetical protein
MDTGQVAKEAFERVEQEALAMREALQEIQGKLDVDHELQPIITAALDSDAGRIIEQRLERAEFRAKHYKEAVEFYRSHHDGGTKAKAALELGVWGGLKKIGD